MPTAIIAIIMLTAAVVLLIKKGRSRMLFANLIIIGAYELFLGIGAASADGWDGIGWFLVAFVAGGIHLLVLFIMALALPDLTQQGNAPELSPEQTAQRNEHIQKAMENLPEQDRGKAKIPRTDAPPARKAPPIQTRQSDPASLSEWEAKQKRLLSKLDENQGGELPFDS